MSKFTQAGGEMAAGGESGGAAHDGQAKKVKPQDVKMGRCLEPAQHGPKPDSDAETDRDVKMGRDADTET